jgi:amidase
MCKEFVRLTGRVVFLLLLAVLQAKANTFQLIFSQEATIAHILTALKAKDLTCRQLVQMYLDRIEAYDRKGPALNAIIMVNPNALATADALDARLAQSELAGPLHCVPIS